MKKILLYGDSNTYGYDPRGMMGMRYAYDVIWPYLVRKELGEKYEIIEEGQNGRPLPTLPREESYLKQLTSSLSDGDIFVIMLGTNDILLTAHPDPDKAVDRMKDLLEWSKTELPGVTVIVIGPVYIDGTSYDLKEYHDASVEMNSGFERVCNEENVIYWNAGEWDIPITYDGVHFSEEGHRVFAEKFTEELNTMVL